MRGLPRVMVTVAALLAVGMATPSVVAQSEPGAGGDPSAAAPGEGDDEGDRLFREGREAFAGGDLDAALEAYRAAWNRKRTYYIAANLGQVELELGMHRDAAEHLAFALATTIPPDVRQAVTKALDEARRHVGALRVSGEPDGAEVVVDGEVVGTVPLATDVFVSPGEHTIELRAAARSSEALTVTADAGVLREVEVSIGGSDAEPTAGGEVPSPRAASDGLAPHWIVLIAGGIPTLALTGVRVGFRMKEKDAAGDVRRLQDVVGDDLAACSGAGSAACDDLRKRERARRDAVKVARGTAIGAGALGVGTAAVFAWMLARGSTGGGEASAARDTRWSAVAHRRGVGVTLRARF